MTDEYVLEDGTFRVLIRDGVATVLERESPTEQWICTGKYPARAT